MEKEFIPYDEALALKELGFGAEPTGSTNGGSIFYYEKGKLYYDGQPMYSSTYHAGQILAPLYQQAFRWFRENYMLSSSIIPHTINHRNETMEYSYNIHGNYTTSVTLGTYEEAELACLRKLIEIIKAK